MKIGKYELENDVDCKRIIDGWEIFPNAVREHAIDPEDFESADWDNGSIMVYDILTEKED